MIFLASYNELLVFLLHFFSRPKVRMILTLARLIVIKF